MNAFDIIIPFIKSFLETIIGFLVGLLKPTIIIPIIIVTFLYWLISKIIKTA